MRNYTSEYKIIVFKKVHGWTDVEIERFILRNDFPDAVAARKHLEDRQTGDGNKKKQGGQPKGAAK